MKTPIIETNINTRWELGLPHHPKSLAMLQDLNALDFALLNGYFDFRTGGDGDNGETLMYLLDVKFECEDANINVSDLLTVYREEPNDFR